MAVENKIDSPICREDLIRKAAKSTFQPDFDWINDREATRVANDPGNRGFTAIEMREMAREFLLAGGKIKCTKETGEEYKKRRHFHYDIVIKTALTDDFPYGLYVEMELSNPDDDEPSVNLLNTHPERGF